MILTQRYWLPCVGQSPFLNTGYSDHEGARAKDTDANRLNFAFLGQKNVLIGHRRLRFSHADVIRYPCPLCAKLRRREAAEAFAEAVIRLVEFDD
jgi:hypothetical protein